MTYRCEILNNLTDNVTLCAYVGMMRRFRNDYFNGNPPYEYTLDVLKPLLQNRKDLIYGFIMKGRNAVGIFENVPAQCGNTPILATATIYIRDKHRNKGISQWFYKYNHTMFDKHNLPWCIHIEESKFLQNKNKFMKMGFTHYYVIPEFTGDSQYKESTYALFCKPYLKLLLPIK